MGGLRNVYETYSTVITYSLKARVWDKPREMINRALAYGIKSFLARIWTHTMENWGVLGIPKPGFQLYW